MTMAVGASSMVFATTTAGIQTVTPLNLATEIWATASATAPVKMPAPNAVTYVTGGITTQNIVDLYYTLSGGAKWTTGEAAGALGVQVSEAGVLSNVFPSGSSAVVTSLGTTNSGATESFAINLGNAAYCSNSTSVTTAAACTAGSGTVISLSSGLPAGSTFTYTPASFVSDAANALATAGSTLSVEFGMADQNTQVTAASPYGNLDSGVSNTAKVASSFIESNYGATGAVLSSDKFTGKAETAKINVLASPTNAQLTNNANVSGAAATTQVNLGSITFTNTANVDNIVTATTTTTAGYAYPSSATTNDAAIVQQLVTLNATQGYFAPLAGAGGLLELTTDAGCTTPVVSATTVGGASLTAATASAATSETLTVPVASLTTAAEYVCFQGNGKTAFVPNVVPTVTVKNMNGTTSTAVALESATGNLYDLLLNVAQVSVKDYLPAAVTNYQTFIHLINTGSVAAQINVYAINPDGTQTAPAQLTTTALAAGGNVDFSSTAIEAALMAAGAPASDFTSSSRPRLVFTAATGSLVAQNFVYDGVTGSLVDMSAQEQ